MQPDAAAQGSLFTPARTAILSPCGRYRYVLRIPTGAPGSRVLNMLLINPSVANAERNDPTATRQTKRAALLGFAWVALTNLFAFIATDPEDMLAAADPVGPDNDEHVLREARGADLVVCGWGVHGVHRGRDEEVVTLLRGAGVVLHALRTTKDGHPEHPLYLPYSLQPVRWRS